MKTENPSKVKHPMPEQWPYRLTLAILQAFHCIQTSHGDAETTFLIGPDKWTVRGGYRDPHITINREVGFTNSEAPITVVYRLPISELGTQKALCTPYDPS